MKSKKTKTNDSNYIANIVQEVNADFLRRQQERKNFELQWQLNMNFLMGNQYSYVTKYGEIIDGLKNYIWQEREVYNHIGPIMESRLAKLAKLNPKVTVTPVGESEEDENSAKTSELVLDSVFGKINLKKVIARATMWSEFCGTSFYKVLWKKSGGKVVGFSENQQKIYEGDVDITVCSPFEIYPDSASTLDVEDCKSIIHAKAMHVNDVKAIWGVDVTGDDVDVFDLSNVSGVGGYGYNGSVAKVSKSAKHNHVVVIEKYEKPTFEFPNGRLIIVAGDTLLHLDVLPFINAKGSERGFPFVKQVSVEEAGSFWGVSVVERIIPVQRAYNAVKNRKHEFLNRISMGVLVVEDGSIDTNNLEDEGISPGKVLIYRQGSTPPRFMESGSVPMDFAEEEDRLLNEFMLISGVSDLMLSSRIKSNINSGVALNLLNDQDDTRFSIVADYIATAISEVGSQILRLYRQFAKLPRIGQKSLKNKTKAVCFSANDIASDEVVCEFIKGEN